MTVVKTTAGWVFGGVNDASWGLQKKRIEYRNCLKGGPIYSGSVEVPQNIKRQGTKVKCPPYEDKTAYPDGFRWHHFLTRSERSNVPLRMWRKFEH